MLALGASALAAPVLSKRAVAADGAARSQAAVDRFAQLDQSRVALSMPARYADMESS